ncbi:hypothetical protein PMAYCL1PPCAC_31142, partial [Pristionchus mayeri]
LSSMEAPLMAMSSDSTHPVHLLPSSAVSSPFYEDDDDGHLEASSTTTKCGRGMETCYREEEQLEHRLQLHFHDPVNYVPRKPNGAYPKSTAAQPKSAEIEQMPRTGSVDSAISVSSNQGYKVKEVGLYTLHEKIGTGMYGAVRRAVHKVTKTEVAVKIVKKTALRPFRNAMMRIYREIEVQKRLHHPFVLDLFQVMETDSTIYLVTDLCQGGELFNVIQKRRRLSEGEARKYFCQLLAAVQYCHERGVVHRDIKAENLLLDEFGNVKLADFGFSNFFTEENLLVTFCGSPQYAAPEVFLGKKYYGPQLDIWSMGVLLHVFLTGSTPFEGRNFAHIQERVLTSHIEYPFYVSHEAAQLMNMMMNRNEDQRATLKQVMTHRWLRHDDIPQMIKNSVSIYDYIVDFIPKDFTTECLLELGVSEEQIRESTGRFDNVDGMNRLLNREYRARRLRKVWADSDTINIVVAAQVLQSEGCRRTSIVARIDPEPIQGELAVREATLRVDDHNQRQWRSFLPGPEEYPYAEFSEEERREREENARELANSSKKSSPSVEMLSSAHSSHETLKLERLRPQVARSTEVPDFEEAQQPMPMKVEKILESVDSSEGYGGENSAHNSLTSINAPDLRRMPSDVCSRMGALDITQKRRSIVEAPEQAPLPKRPSLPECLSLEMERGSIHLAKPPKQKNERKTFFEKMRLKRKKAHGLRQETIQARPNWYLPPPPLAEGGSFDDPEESKGGMEI